MNRPKNRRAKLRAGALLVAIACVGSDCPPPLPPTAFVEPFPSFSGLVQQFSTSIDEGSDNTFEAPAVVQAVLGGGSDPGVLGTSTVIQSVTISAASDSDSILVHCEESLMPGNSQTACAGTIRARFDNTSSGFALFTAQAQAWGDDVSGFSLGNIALDCGIDSGAMGVEFGLSGDPDEATDFDRVEVEPGTPCTVTIGFDAGATAFDLQEAGNSRQTVAVSVSTTDLLQCTRSSQCPSELPVCGPEGFCDTGDEGSAATVARLHCVVPFISTFFGCSRGVAGSACGAGGQCADGNSCNAADVCEGDIACNDDSDCPATASNCTDQRTCSEHGEQGDACVFTQACRQGLLCESNRCTEILQLGDPCPEDFARCDGGSFCDPDTSACEPLRLPGEVCSANDQCADDPPTNYTCILDVCVPAETTGGQCDDDFDCQFTTCNTSTNVCN